MKGISRPCAWAWASKTSIPPAARPLGELVAEAALADARLGDDPDHGALAGLGPLQRRLQHGHLLAAADEAGEAALAREVEPRARRADPGQLEHAAPAGSPP